MNKIVRRHYPASRLPSELRGEIDPAHDVTVTVVDETPSEKRRELRDLLARPRKRRLSEEEILATIRAERDSWDG